MIAMLKSVEGQASCTGKMTSRTTFSFRTPGAVVRYDSRTKEKKESVRNGVRNGKMK